jgi:hypothetical protein
MSTINSTVSITSGNNPYTLSAGSTISISSSSDSNNAGEAIYTNYSPTNATTIGGPTIVIDGTIIDNSPQANPNEYAVQSVSPAQATLFNFGIINAPNLIAVGFNNGVIINEVGGTITGAGGIRIGGGSLDSTIINYGEIEGSASAGIGFLSPSAPAVITNEAGGYIRGGLTGNLASESGIYNLSGTITNAGTIAAGGTAGDSIDFFGTAGHDALILDPGEVLRGAATAAGAGNMLILGGTGLGTLSNPGNYLGFTTMSVATGADWTIGTAGSTVSISGISTINDFSTLNIAGAIAGATINMEGSIAGTATQVDFTGAYSATPIIDYGVNDEIVFTTLAGAAGTTYQDSYNTATGILTVTEINASGTAIGAASASVSGAPGTTLSSGSFVDINGPNGETVVLGGSTLANAGSIYLDYGASDTLTNTGAVDAVPVTFGSHQSSLGILNTLDINGSVSGTNSPYTGTISGFGLNDDIILGPSVLPSQILGGQDVLSYAGSLLSVTEFNATGTSIGSTTIDIGTGYSTGSFLALLGSNGVNIETPATVIEKPLTFNASGTANFETTTDYAGGLAPGSSIVAGETVIIASGTAAVSTTAPVSNSGTILVSGASSGFVDAGTLSGNGTVIAAAGASVTLATDAGTVLFGAATAGTPNVLDLNGSATGFTGTVAGFGANDEIVLGTNVLAAGGTGTSYINSYNTSTGVLTVSELNAAGSVVGSTSLTVANTGGTLNASSFVDISGPNGVTLALSSTQLGNAGSIFIDRGQHVTLGNTSGVDTIPVTFGSNGTSLALNVLDLNGTVSGTNSPYQGAISGFGLNDDIILGPSVLPSVATGDTVTLSYTGSLLTVTELNSGGTAIGATTLNVGTGYAAGAFVALLGANGVNLETPQTVDEQNFVFGALTQGTNYQGDFENPNDYQGGLAPGATIVAGETVTVQEPAQANVTTALTNNGLIVLDALNSNMDATAAISGTGTIDVGNGSDLVLANSIGSTTDTIAFTGSGLLDLAGSGTASFTGTITGEDKTDTIEIGGSVLPTPSSASAISLSFNTSTGVLSIFDTVGGSVVTETLHFAGPVSNNFSAAVSGGNIVISDVPCFAAGTRILTADGARPVETLRVNDAVLTARDGAERRIIWTGQRTIDLATHANPDKVRPVVIAAGAFSEGMPERDLKLSPDHALYIDGHLIEAKTLVNGATIFRDHGARYVTYHHIELARHDVVLAEGLPAETYLDSGNRRNFETDAGPITLHPDFAAASRAGACARLLTDGRVVRRVRQHLLDRALALGFTRTSRLEVIAKAGAELIEPMEDAISPALLFILPQAASSVVLRCATGVPAEVTADPSDRRELGLAIAELALVVNGERIKIDLNDPAHTGLFEAEPGQRWTGSAARIALPPHRGRGILELTINGQAQRWRRTTGSRSVLAN